MDTLQQAAKACESRLRRQIRTQWHSDLENILSSLEEAPGQHMLQEEDTLRLKIRVSQLPLETEHALDFGPRFFTPFAKHELLASPCTLCTVDDGRDEHNVFHPPPEDPYDLHNYSRRLAYMIKEHLSATRLEHDNPSEWQAVSNNPFYYKDARYAEKYSDDRHNCEHRWIVETIHDKFSKTKPHLMLVMTSDHTAGDKLLKSEMIAMVGFMMARFKSRRRRKHVIHPILIVSILNTRQVRILQGHFDGHLNVRCSKVIDCSGRDHEEAMSLIVQWLMSKPCGSTTVSSLLGVGSNDTNDFHEHDSGDLQPHAAQSVRVAS